MILHIGSTRSREAEIRILVTRGSEEGVWGVGRQCLMEFQFRKMKKFWTVMLMDLIPVNFMIRICCYNKNKKQRKEKLKEPAKGCSGTTLTDRSQGQMEEQWMRVPGMKNEQKGRMDSKHYPLGSSAFCYVVGHSKAHFSRRTCSVLAHLLFAVYIT